MLSPYFKKILHIIWGLFGTKWTDKILTGGRIFLGILLYEYQLDN